MNNSDVLADFTDDELAEELLRRAQSVPAVPEMLDEPLLKYMAQLTTMAANHIAACVDDTIYDKDTEHYMYEAVMQMFYGPDIFEKFINSNMR